MGNLIKRLAVDLLLPPKDIVSLINSAPYRYRVYSIPKRSGRGARIIAQPTPAVKELQYWVMNNILSRLPTHESATAYKLGYNIAANAIPHAANTFLLKLDFANFFNSIRPSDFSILTSNTLPEYDAIDLQYLVRILFWKVKEPRELVLSVGAPSSPMLSNSVLFSFDKAVSAYCESQSVRYTRYADDLSFSTSYPGVLAGVERHVSTLLREMNSPSLRINLEKTVHASSKGNRRVTGLVLTNSGTVSLGREKKRIVRSMIHRFRLGKLSKQEVVSLRGLLSFINSVEPLLINRWVRQYGLALMIELVGHELRKDAS